MPPANAEPRVSVLMPTFRQAAFLPRALESLRAQTFTDWELIIVDDGSPDETPAVVAPYLADSRVRYERLPANGGLGAALNRALALARALYIAYLPSDDVYYPEHLARLVALLDARPDVYLAYGGVRWRYELYGPTLEGEAPVGREAEAMAAPVPREARLPSGNILALPQVLHRRDLERMVAWTPREAVVSDTLEADYWRGLLAHGATFAYGGGVTCEWVDHPDQRHKLIAGPLGSLAVYRAHYGLGRGQWLRWRPTRGWIVDERARFGRFAGERALPAPGGLKILLVGSLGFNPERIMALEERGHQLFGLWLPHPEKWDTTGPLAYGNVEDIAYAPGWVERVRAIQPDVIYALLNWQAVPMISEVVAAGLDIPMVYHFKEGPFICQEKGAWPALLRILDHSAGRIFISDEMFDWFQLATDGRFDPATVMILDGDLPKIDWLTDDWAPKLSAADGEIHTVCAGRPIGLDPFEALAAEGIHVHFYGEAFQQHTPNFIRAGLATGYMHLHPSVEPPDWVPELSRYDAGWFHVFDSYNGGDLRRAHWDDLNLAARLGTYAAAGLPWILKDTGAGRTSVGSLARRHDVGVFFRDFADLGRRLRDRPRLAAQTAHMRAARGQFAFDTHADALVAFFRAAIARHAARA